MIIVRALAFALLLAAPAAAQDAAQETGEPDFNGQLVDDCLAGQGGEGGNPLTCVGVAADVCMNAPGVYSTAGMSFCLGEEFEHWDGLLNLSYGKVMDQAKAADSEMKSIGSAAEEQAPLLQQMQRDWIAFRDAACAYERSKWGGGTGGGPASIQCMLDLTAQQYLRLGAGLDEAR